MLYILMIAIGLFVLYGVYYAGYRMGEKETHERRNSITKQSLRQK